MTMQSVLIFTLAGLLLVPAGLSAQASADEDKQRSTANTWAGVLADADCKARQPDKACEVSASTASFGLVMADGSFAKLDAQGNSLAANHAKGKQGPIKVKVTGKLAGDTIAVEQLSPDR